ncbi:unnamed protein product [Eruca vesicaria subsp. sativa]|uniref:Transcriptional regulator SLK2 n=1 Tax=Eruca vesicaria subsp. sativa TaxID=29727 RepID=A0ABC8L6X1_ERUVS|nr:unnamed protein product [Eruca vesicaria subsp. sativa]
MAAGMTPSSSTSGIFFQGDNDESQSFINSHFTSSYGNNNNPPGCGGYHNLSDLHNPAAMMSVSTPGASSMVTDANSGGGGGLSGGGPNLQRSASINNESYLRLPASPLSFSSSSVADGSTVVQRGGSSATSLRRGASETFFQDPTQARKKPREGSIVYWRKFVNEYFSPRAKKRWCLSHYDNVGHSALGVSPQAATEEWQCDLCGSKSGRGFEATFDVLPRLNEIKFASGVLDELLYLSVPAERRFPSGVMVLEYAKAVQESVYEHIRVVREGHLRIIFSQELKILSWEFCTRRHEELLPRRLVAPQVNQLLQVAEKCQSTIDQSGPDGIHQQDLQANSNMVMAAGRQLAKSLESHSLNDLGFSKRYVRCLQISEVVSSMKDMIDMCRDQKVGPIEALKSYPYRMRTGKMQMQEVEQVAANASQGLAPDRNSVNKLMSLRNNIPMNGGQGSAQAAAFALTNYQTMLMKQNAEQTNGSLQQESTRNMSPSPSYQGAIGSSHLSPQWQMPSSSYSNSSVHQQYQQQQQPSCSGSNNQALEQQMIHQIWQQMANSNGGGSGQQQQTLSGQNMGRNRTDYVPTAETPSTSNRFRGVKGLEQGQNQEGMVVSSNNTCFNFENNGFFSNGVDESMEYPWKA